MATLKCVSRASLLMIALAGLLSCRIASGSTTIEAQIMDWYGSPSVRIPLRADEGIRFVEYSYEYNAGAGWVVDQEATLSLPSDGRTLLDLRVSDPDWEHRVTLNGLARQVVGGPFEVVDTLQRTFSVDTEAPSAEPGSLVLTPYQFGAVAPGPEFDPAVELQLEIRHIEFDDPSGAPVAVVISRDGSPPLEGDETRTAPDRITVWNGGESTYLEEYRFQVIDAAGNRSGVRNLVFQSFP